MPQFALGYSLKRHQIRAMFSTPGLGPQLDEERVRVDARQFGFVVEDPGRDEAAEANSTCAAERTEPEPKP